MRSGGAACQRKRRSWSRRGGWAERPPWSLEFAKVNGREVWLDRLLWMLTGILLWSGVGLVANTVTEVCMVAIWWGFGYVLHSPHPVLAGVLWGVVRLASLVLCVLGCTRLLGRAGGRLTKAIAYLVERPGRVVLGVVAISLLLLAGIPARTLENIYWMHHAGIASLGAYYQSLSLSQLFNALLTTVALVTAALLLARRHLRRRIKA